MITTAVKTELDEATAALEIEPSLVAPSFSELAALAQVQDVSLRYVQVLEDGKLVGCAACHVEDGRIHGLHCKMYRLYNGKLHDYRLVYLAHPKFFRPLLRAAKQDARQLGADLVVFDSFASPVPLRELDGVKVENIQIFDATKDAKGWAGIYGRKNIARQLKRYVKQESYSVQCIEVNRQSIDRLGQLHRERWGSEGINSPFLSPRRVDEYLVCPENKVLLQIRYKGEVLAEHYGMMYGKTLLWHTPIINIKYLDASPLRLLLPETALYCEREGLQCMDLGFGDDAYKERFANGYRATGTTYAAITGKGYLHNCLCGLLDPGRIKQTILDRRAKLNAKRASMARFVTKVNEYSLEQPPHHAAPVTGSEFHVFRDYHDFVDFMRANHLQVERKHYQIFKESDVLYLLADEEGISLWGRGTTQDDFLIGEINRSITTSGQHIVFGLETLRTTGDTPAKTLALLNGILKKTHDTPVLLLAPAGDAALNDATIRAGGTLVATHTHWQTRPQ